MKIKFFQIILSIILAFGLCSCSHAATPADDEYTVNIAALKGPTAIGLIELISESNAGTTANKYNYNIYGTADEISALAAKGELDIAAIPCNLASVLCNKTNGAFRIAGINTLGVLYILSKEKDIKKISDLKGTTIYTTGAGTTPEYTLRYILTMNGIDPDNDVNIVFYSEASQVVSEVSTLESAVLMLPQPYVSIALNSDSSLNVVLDLNREWESCSDNGSAIVTGVIIAREEFINNHPEQFNNFLKEYELSIEFANSHTQECAALLEKYDIFKASIAQQAIPQCNITFITGEAMRTKILGYLKVLYDASPKSVGGALPDDSLFYMGDYS